MGCRPVRFELIFFNFFYRFGKTFAVSMFAAAMLYSTPCLELSIYSTCKRISQKLMRNVMKFLDLIYRETKDQPMQVIRSNMEEVVLKGPDGIHDVRTVNSYPSKVGKTSLTHTHTHYAHSTGSPVKCSLVRVDLWFIFLLLFPRWKFSIRYASESTCSASRASFSHRRSLLKSWAISRTRRCRAAMGMAETVSESTGRLFLALRV